MDTRRILGLPAGRTSEVFAHEKVVRERPAHKFPKKEGHDALIAALAKRGATIYLTMLNGEPLTGVLKESDRFTITILEGEGDDTCIRLIYKHAIESFTLDTTANVGTRSEV